MKGKSYASSSNVSDDCFFRYFLNAVENFLSKTTFNGSFTDQEQNVLRYDPKIEFLVESTLTLTLAFHGWGDSKDGMEEIKQYRGVLPGDVVMFNFKDAVENFSSPELGKTNFGQAGDISSALIALKKMYSYAQQNKIDKIQLYGHSLGGATIVNLLWVFCNLNNEYADLYKKLDINEQARKDILLMVQKGSVVLNCPLAGVGYAVEQQIKNTVNHAVDNSTSPVDVS